MLESADVQEVSRVEHMIDCGKAWKRGGGSQDASTRGLLLPEAHEPGLVLMLEEVVARDSNDVEGELERRCLCRDGVSSGGRSVDELRRVFFFGVLFPNRDLLLEKIFRIPTFDTRRSVKIISAVRLSESERVC
jgi:hypothetical protein